MTAIVRTVSSELQSLIDQANATFGRGFEIVKRIYDTATGQGFTPMEARDLILDSVTAFKKSTLYSYIPAEAKDKVKSLNRSTKKFVPKLEQTDDEEKQEVTIKESHQIIDAETETETESPSAVEQWESITILLAFLSMLTRVTTSLVGVGLAAME